MAPAVRLLFLALVFSAQAAAQHVPDPHNTVELQAEASREIANDTLKGVLYAEANNTDAAALADSLNRAANQALKIAADFKPVQARTGGQNAYPVYDRNQRLTGWRGRAHILLESRDFRAAAQLIGKLQSQMQLESIAFSVAPETRKAAENELIAEAIRAFRARADIVRQALGGKTYKLRRIAIHTPGFVRPPRPLMQRAPGDARAAEVQAPVFEGGRSLVTVGVSGTIEVE